VPASAGRKKKSTLQGLEPKGWFGSIKQHPLFFVLKQRKAPKENSRRIDPTSHKATCTPAIRQPARCAGGAIALKELWIDHILITVGFSPNRQKLW
jgi:hypothetical protein